MASESPGGHVNVIRVTEEMRSCETVWKNGTQLTQFLGIGDPSLIDLPDYGLDDAGRQEPQ